jgi:hypothetical protein
VPGEVFVMNIQVAGRAPHPRGTVMATIVYQILFSTDFQWNDAPLVSTPVQARLGPEEIARLSSLLEMERKFGELILIRSDREGKVRILSHNEKHGLYSPSIQLDGFKGTGFDYCNYAACWRSGLDFAKHGDFLNISVDDDAISFETDSARIIYDSTWPTDHHLLEYFTGTVEDALHYVNNIESDRKYKFCAHYLINPDALLKYLKKTIKQTTLAGEDHSLEIESAYGIQKTKITGKSSTVTITIPEEIISTITSIENFSLSLDAEMILQTLQAASSCGLDHLYLFDNIHDHSCRIWITDADRSSHIIQIDNHLDLYHNPELFRFNLS